MLRNLTIDRPDHVWCADITYVPMPGGHAYLCAVMDWQSREVLGWAVSNTMETGLCLEVLENALATTGRVPDIFNTDQGCQFTSAEWIGRLLDLGVKISMDGRGRWMDNVFIERLWRSVKYEEIYLFEHATVPTLREGLTKWFGRYNGWRPHEALGNLTPAVVYQTAAASPRDATRGAACPPPGAAKLGILRSRLRTSLRYAPLRAAPSTPASQFRFPATPTCHSSRDPRIMTSYPLPHPPTIT